MTTPLATVAQVLKLAGMFTDVPRDQMNGIGFGLSAIVAEYLCQLEPKRLSLKTVRQVLGLSPLADDVWITVDWQEAQPTQHFEAATIRQRAKPRRTVLTRLRPTDVGLSNDAHPNDVIDLAVSWGYKSVPRAALETLLRNLPASRGHYSGYAMVPLGDAQYAYLEIFTNGPVLSVGQMDVTEPYFATTWSVIVSC